MTGTLTVDALPAPLFRSLSSADLAILRQLFFIFNHTKVRSRDQQQQITPSEPWLAKKCGVTRKTVSRFVQKAKRLKLLWVRQFHDKEKGTWSCNFYRIHKVATRWWAARIREKRPFSHRGTFLSHLNPSGKRDIAPSADERTDGASKGGCASNLQNSEQPEEVQEWLRARGIGRN